MVDNKEAPPDMQQFAQDMSKYILELHWANCSGFIGFYFNHPTRDDHPKHFGFTKFMRFHAIFKTDEEIEKESTPDNSSMF
jgi:hypothetical protein